jgi:hypothetical protein
MPLRGQGVDLVRSRPVYTSAGPGAIRSVGECFEVFVRSGGVYWCIFRGERGGLTMLEQLAIARLLWAPPVPRP